MCLGIPARVIELKGEICTVEFGGFTREVDPSLVSELSPGDYVIVHAGAIISKLSPEEAKETLEVWSALIEKLGELEAEERSQPDD